MHRLLQTFTTDDLDEILESGIKFRTVYADPPWKYDNTASRGAAENHYTTMTVEEIAALPVPDLITHDAHLHLWTTAAFLFEAKTVLEAWGFEYKSYFVWIKEQMGLGNYWRKGSEIMLLGIRGRLPFRNHSQLDYVIERKTVHSKKPDVVRDIIETVSPHRYLELFGRQIVPGWTVWGNQIDYGYEINEVQHIA